MIYTNQLQKDFYFKLSIFMYIIILVTMFVVLVNINYKVKTSHSEQYISKTIKN